MKWKWLDDTNTWACIFMTSAIAVKCQQNRWPKRTHRKPTEIALPIQCAIAVVNRGKKSPANHETRPSNNLAILYMREIFIIIDINNPYGIHIIIICSLFHGFDFFFHLKSVSHSNCVRYCWCCCCWFLLNMCWIWFEFSMNSHVNNKCRMFSAAFCLILFIYSNKFDLFFCVYGVVRSHFPHIA